MVGFLISVGVVAIVLGIWAIAISVSDIQLILGSVLGMGGIISIGLGFTLSELRKLSSSLNNGKGSGTPSP